MRISCAHDQRQTIYYCFGASWTHALLAYILDLSSWARVPVQTWYVQWIIIGVCAIAAVISIVLTCDAVVCHRELNQRSTVAFIILSCFFLRGV